MGTRRLIAVLAVPFARAPTMVGGAVPSADKEDRMGRCSCFTYVFVLALPVPDGLRAAETARAGTAFPRFEIHRIDAIGTQLGQTALADLDSRAP